jgi:hypothetical protein
MTNDVVVTNNEVTFEFNELIVSKTNLKGHILYANDVFLNIAGFNESALKKHSKP